MRLIRKRRIIITGSTGENYIAIAYWDNLLNPINLNGICTTLGIESSYLAIPGTRQDYHLAPYMVYDSPETGVIFRLGIFKYEHELLGWGSDGMENEVEYFYNYIFKSLLKDVMSALGLEYKEYPTPQESIALVEKLSELDTDFRKEFNKCFEIEEISDNVHSLAIYEWEQVDKRQEFSATIRRDEKKMNELSSLLEETRKYLQRTLIDCHFERCAELVRESQDIDSNFQKKKIDYEKALNDSTVSKKQLAVLKNLLEGARLKYNNLHDKRIAMIFGKDARIIDYQYLKEYVQTKLSE